jgi:hypothetical protein
LGVSLSRRKAQAKYKGEWPQLHWHVKGATHGSPLGSIKLFLPQSALG